MAERDRCSCAALQRTHRKWLWDPHQPGLHVSTLGLEWLPSPQKEETLGVS